MSDTPEPFWWDDNDNISRFVSSFMAPHDSEAIRSAHDLALEIAFAYRKRIAELELDSIYLKEVAGPAIEQFQERDRQQKARIAAPKGPPEMPSEVRSAIEAAMRVIRNSLDEPSEVFSEWARAKARAEIDAAFAWLDSLPEEPQP